MPTLKEWLENMAGGEPIEALVLGKMTWDAANQAPNYMEQPSGVLLSWTDAIPWISYDFYAGYGTAERSSVVAWTASWVISVSQHDGSTAPFRIARNPTAHKPIMPRRRLNK